MEDHLRSPSDQPASTEPTPLPAAPLRRRRFPASLLALVAALLIILFAVLLSGLPGLMAGGKQQSATPTPQATPSGLNLTGFRLHSISMISPEEGWVAGDRPRAPNPPDPFTGEQDLNAVEPVILHYKRGHWSLERLPSNLNPYNLDMTLSSISMVSASEGWAAGSTLLPAYPNAVVDGITVPVLLHYSGGAWALVRHPPAAFGSILMRSASEGWAIGSAVYPDAYGALALRYNGQTWTKITAPAFASLTLQALAAAPNGELWITGVDYSEPGFDGDAPAAILHYAGGAWTRAPANLANDRLLGLAMVSATEGWAVGYDPGGTRSHYIGPQRGLIVHYHHGVWKAQSTFASPSGDTFFYLSAVAMVSATEGWAVGQEGVIAHYHNGAWARVRSPTNQALQSIVMLSPTEGWAIGNNGTILHYQSGVWSVYRG